MVTNLVEVNDFAGSFHYKALSSKNLKLQEVSLTGRFFLVQIVIYAFFAVLHKKVEENARCDGVFERVL